MSSFSSESTSRQSAETSAEVNYEKPNFSYSSMIIMAIEHHHHKMPTLSEIYSFILEKFPYFKHTKKDWKNAIRHSLSISKLFEKVQRLPNQPGKGNCWVLSTEGLNTVLRQTYYGQETMQRKQEEIFMPIQRRYTPEEIAYYTGCPLFMQSNQTAMCSEQMRCPFRQQSFS